MNAGADAFAHSVEAEQAVLAALLVDASALKRVGALGIEDFVGADHRAIFTAILDQAEDGAVDLVTVCERLRRNGEDEGIFAYVASLAQNVPSVANVGRYAKLVREHSRRRDLAALGAELQERAARADLAELRSDLLTRVEAIETDEVKLDVPPTSTWAARTPPSREWTWRGRIPARRVTSLMGDGGVGKSILAQMILTACASGRGELYGEPMASGVALGVFSEEEQDELERRQRPICAALGVDLGALENLYMLSRLGHSNLIATYSAGIAVPTDFYWQIDATIASLRPHLVVLDPAADFFGGNPIMQSEVRQFVQVILGGLCMRHGCTVLLPMHPSAAGLASGDGAGFSVAWSNSVRSRLYLEHGKQEGDVEAGRVTLTRKKSNYAARGEALDLVFENGAFVPARHGVVEAIAAGNARRWVLCELLACERLGRRVASSPHAGENAATILGEREGFPREFRGRGKGALFSLLRRLQDEGALEEATVKNASRHPLGIWQLTPKGREEAGT